MENWVEIKGDPGYMVNSEGRVLGPRGKVLKQEHCRDGYRRVNIYGNHQMVHRIVAMAFIPNPGNLEQVNHKDEIRSNNSVLNLEWVSAKENMNYGHRMQNSLITKRITLSKTSQLIVFQYDLLGHLKNCFRSTREAERFTGINSSHISASARGLRKTAGGFLWKYAEESLYLQP